MTEKPTGTKRFQWKWFGIAIGAYIVFYVLPILIAAGTFSSTSQGPTADVLIAIWSLGGIIIIAALVGYFSEGVALWEPVVAASLLFAILFPVRSVQILISGFPFVGRLSILYVIKHFIVLLAIAFILSLVGAGLGGAFGEHRNSEGRKMPESR